MHYDKNNQRLQEALEELKQIILKKYPEAFFTVVEGEEDTVHLEATVDVIDTDMVLDLVLKRLFEFQDEGLRLHVHGLRTPKRNAEVHKQLERDQRRIHGTL